MPIPAKFVVTVTYKSLMGVSSTEEEFFSEVNKYKNAELNKILCFFNHILGTWRGGVNDEMHSDLVNAYCPPEIKQKINSLPNFDGNPRYLFHRLQLLYLIKRTILSDGLGQNRPLGNTNNGDLWKVLSMANEHIDQIVSSFPEGLERDLAIIGNFLSGTEFSRSHYRHGSKLARSVWLYENFTETFSQINLEKIFNETTGLTITEYRSLIVGIMTYYNTDSNPEQTKVEPNKIFLDVSDWFRNCSIEESKLERFFQDISFSIEEFKAN